MLHLDVSKVDQLLYMLQCVREAEGTRVVPTRSLAVWAPYGHVKPMRRRGVLVFFVRALAWIASASVETETRASERGPWARHPGASCPEYLTKLRQQHNYYILLMGWGDTPSL